METLIEHIFKTITESDAEYKEVGTVSEDLRLRYVKMIKDKDKLVQQVKLQKDMYEAEMELKLLKEYGDRIQFHEELKDVIWREITDELKVDPKKNYSINRETGLISEKLRNKEGSPTDKFISKLKLAGRMPK
jgi:hypothetical protein